MSVTLMMLYIVCGVAYTAKCLRGLGYLCFSGNEDESSMLEDQRVTCALRCARCHCGHHAGV